MSSNYEQISLADRFALQQTWWIASELCRRHPELLISRLQDSEQNQLLLVHDGPTGKRVQFGLTGGIKYEQGGTVRQIDWPSIIAQHNAHDVLKRLEHGTGWGSPTDTPATTHRTLVYRIVAKLLALNLDDRHEWQAVPLPILGDEDEPVSAWGLLDQFPSLRDAADGYLEYATALAAADEHETAFWHEPLWMLLRDMEPVAVLDEAGTVHLAETTPVDLMDAYDSVERDLNPVVGFLLIKTSASSRALKSRARTQNPAHMAQPTMPSREERAHEMRHDTSPMIYVLSAHGALFRYRSDRTWENQRWDAEHAGWINVGDYAHDKLFWGDPNFDEISEEDARHNFPRAFDDAGGGASR